MNFHEAENYLCSLGNEVETMKLGLENIRILLEALENPQNRYKKVQVAGTNGKGSVCAFLDSICLQAGIKTGRYTSPHLVSIRERIKVVGVDISKSEFARHASRVRETAERLVADGALETIPTFFEQVTAIALLAFADAKVELAILETGLGGRYDATTAANAEIAAITRIDLDHQEYLGDTIEKIASEKAAIIRADSEIVIGRQSKEAERVIARRCREVGIEPVWTTSDIVTKKSGDPSYPIYTHTFTTRKDVYPNVDLGLLGGHQAENAAVAIGIAEILQDAGYAISHLNICIGLEKAKHSGRMEFDGGILLDGAHNTSGAVALRNFLNDFVDRPVTLVFGAMKDKSVAAILENLAERAEMIILTQPENIRAMKPSEVLKVVPTDFDRGRVFTSNSVEEALKLAREQSIDGMIVVTGSLYLVGEVKKLLHDDR